nr:MAG TPA: hypothetical protein [Caudoviricetes sp.]
MHSVPVLVGRYANGRNRWMLYYRSRSSARRSAG